MAQELLQKELERMPEESIMRLVEYAKFLNYLLHNGDGTS